MKYKHDTEIVNVKINILDDRAAAVCNDGVLIYNGQSIKVLITSGNLCIDLYNKLVE